MQSTPQQFVDVTFDSAAYSITAIQKAAYRFGNLCYIRIETTIDGRVSVQLTPKATVTSPESLAGDLRNEVLDQHLREVVAEETGRVRDLILAQAFSAVSLIDAIGESGDAVDDPLGIRAQQTFADRGPIST